MSGFEFFGSAAVIASFVLMVLAVLIPVWLYLINVYTYQTRNELREINKNIERFLTVIEKQETPIQAIQAEAGGALSTQCKGCGKRFRHSANLSGTTKPCSSCGQPITFT